MTGNSWWR